MTAVGPLLATVPFVSSTTVLVVAAITDDLSAIEGAVGLGIVSAFAVLMGYVLRAAKQTEEARLRILEEFEGLLESANADRDRWMERAVDAERKLVETRRKYEEERSLRISLENAGIVDRRNRPDAVD